MGWNLGYDNNWHRFVVYGVVAYCDHPGCNETIDRGLAYVCGGDVYGGEHGCGLFFCEKHRDYYKRKLVVLCHRCGHHKKPYKPKPEHPEWINHILTDKSWEEWRKENPEEVKELKKTLTKGLSHAR